MTIRFVLFALILHAFVTPSPLGASASVRAADVAPRTRVDLARLPLAFEPNVGQTDGRVAYTARANGFRLFVTPTEAVFALRGAGRSVVRLRFAGSEGSRRIEGEAPLPGRVNFFLGADPASWRADVATFGRVRSEDVYPGIDVVFRGDDGTLEYDLHVEPGSDPSRIAMALDGASAISVDDSGDLVVATADGELRQRRPVAFQLRDGLTHAVACGFTIDEAGRVRYRLGQYDRSLPLTIDPAVTYATYLGGSGSEAAAGVAVDAQGNAYLVGGTDSANFPTTPGALQPTYSGALTDAFVTKLNAAGTALVYSTYLGGNGDEAIARVVLDASNNAYVVGGTGSTNFPTTAGAFQTTFRGGSFDGFVAKLDAAGAALLFATYLGGGGDEGVSSAVLDSSGNVYLTGASASTNFPTTAGAFDTSGGNILGIPDAFVTKMNPSGTGLVYSTYAGSSFNLDGGAAIAVDSSGNAYVAGASNGNFPTTAGAFQTSFAGNFDGFALKLNAAGSALVYSTYLGGGGEDYCFGLALDAGTNVYLTGYTNSTTFPTAAPFQATNAGGFDAFVTKLSPSGGSLVYSSYIGGSGNEGLTSNGGLELQIAGAIAIDGSGNAFLTGFTDSTDFPTTSPVQAMNGGGFDAWVAQVNPAGSGVVYSSYLGGSLEERGLGIAVDGSGAAYAVGVTFSTNFPATPGAFQTTSGGGTDATDGFVAKFAGGGEVDSAGIYIGSAGSWFLRNANGPGPADVVFVFGPSGGALVPLRGDWDGDGDDTIGLYDPATAVFFLRNANASGPADVVVVFGPAGAGLVPIAGDWDGDGDDTVGLYAPATGALFLRNSNSNGPADVVFTFGPGGAGFTVVTGDWDGNGADGPGLYDPATGAFFLKNVNGNGPADIVFTYGPAGVSWIALAGDWDGDGDDTIGLYDPAAAAWFVRITNASGPADSIFVYGPPAATPVVGDWNGQ